MREEARQRLVSFRTANRPFSYSRREPGSSEILMCQVWSSGVTASITIRERRLLCIFENFSECKQISFDLGSFSELAKTSIRLRSRNLKTP